MKSIYFAEWPLAKPFGRFEVGVRTALSEDHFDAIDATGNTITIQSRQQMTIQSIRRH